MPSRKWFGIKFGIRERNMVIIGLKVATNMVIKPEFEGFLKELTDE